MKTIGAVITSLLVAISLTGAVSADPPPSLDPFATNTAAGLLQDDGTYLWAWDVFGGQRPALSQWTLDICEEVFDDIVPGSVIGGPVEFRDALNPDPPTGAFVSYPPRGG